MDRALLDPARTGAPIPAPPTTSRAPAMRDAAPILHA
jgi:hypothetical protein